MNARTDTSWDFLEPDVESILQQCALPLEELARGTTPAIVLRQAFSPAACQQLIDRLIVEELLFDPAKPVPTKFREQAIPEGYYREGRNSEPTSAWQAKTESGRSICPPPARS